MSLCKEGMMQNRHPGCTAFINTSKWKEMIYDRVGIEFPWEDLGYPKQPSEMYVDYKNNKLFVYEIHSQKVAGSADVKLEAGIYKIEKYYNRVAKDLGNFELIYTFILDPGWFRDNANNAQRLSGVLKTLRQIGARIEYL